MTAQERQGEPFRLVAIIGSAGGLTPLRAIIGQLTADLDAAVVVLMHRGARGRSYLTEILSRATTLPVVLVKGGETLEPATIYVVPPGDQHASVAGHTIHLVPGSKVSFHRPAGDPLLTSAAACFGRQAVAVVLSGMGHNGAAGVAAIKQAGGKVLVQSPDEAEWPSMPEFALQAAKADLCAPADELGRVLVDLCSGAGGEPSATPAAATQP